MILAATRRPFPPRARQESRRILLALRVSNTAIQSQGLRIQGPTEDSRKLLAAAAALQGTAHIVLAAAGRSQVRTRGQERRSSWHPAHPQRHPEDHSAREGHANDGRPIASWGMQVVMPCATPSAVAVVEELAEALSCLANTLASEYTMADVANSIVTHAPRILAIAGSGLSLASGPQLRFAAASDEVMARVERSQAELQQGPCIDAHRNGTPMLVANLHSFLGRWPRFARLAISCDVVAAAGIPLRLSGSRLGAFNLYATAPRTWSEADVQIASVLADLASALLLNALARDGARRTIGQLREALDSRIVIEQAKGVLAAERGIPVDSAFELLRAHARRHHAALRSVADAVVRLGLRP